MGIERQHYVPQGFLRGFTIDDPLTDKLLWVYEKMPDRRPRKESVRSVAWESYYYEQEHEDGSRDMDSFERNLAQTIDDVIPKLLRSLDPVVGRPIDISGEYKGALAFFLGLAMTRVPSFREPMQKYFSKIAQLTLNNLAERDQQVRDGIEKYGVIAEAKVWASLHPMVQLARMIGESALRKRWQFFVAPPEMSLVTSDNPVIFSVGTTPRGAPIGPAHPLAELVVNLRKDLALVCTPKQGYPDLMVFPMTTQDAKKFNRVIVRAARRFVFCDFYSDTMDAFVKKYQGQEQTILVD